MSLVMTLLGLTSLGAGGYTSARVWFRLPRGLPALLGGVVLAWIWLTLGTLALGLSGWLTRDALLSWSLMGGLTALARGKIGHVPNLLELSRPKERIRWDTGLGIGLTLWSMSVMAGQPLLFPAMVMSDAPIYHLYFAARWWKAERIFMIPTPFGESAAPYFPAVGDLWHTWLFVMRGGDSWAKVGQIPFLGIASLVVFALTRRLGAGLNASIIAVCYFATVSPLLVFSFQANVDTTFIASYLLGIYFASRFFLREDGTGSLALAALALGGAWGCKAPGIVFVPPLLMAMAMGVLFRRGSWRERIANFGIVLILPFVLEGYWLIRNGLLTGNPLYPIHITILGKTLLHGWYGPDAMLTSPYFIAREDWRAFLDILLSVCDPRLLPFWIGAIVASAWATRRKGGEAKIVLGCGLLAIINIALYWLIIPYRTQQRFLLHAVALAAVPLAMLLDRRRYLQCLGVIALIFHVLTPEGWPFLSMPGMPYWDFSKDVPNNSPGPIPLFTYIATATSDRGTRTQVAAITKLGIGFVWLVWGLTLTWTWNGGWRRRVVSLLVPLLLVLAPLVLITWENPSKILYRFPFFADYMRGWVELDSRIVGDGTRIAYAGTNLAYYLMGPEFRNEVRYVNIDAHRDWLMHDYHRASLSLGMVPVWPDTRPGWDRGNPDYLAWLSNLRAERIQLLVVTRANPVEGRLNVADPEGFTIERVWADAHPEVFRRLYQDQAFRIYAVQSAK